MEKINVLALQMESVISDKYSNFEKVIDFVHRKITKDTDVLVLPELWTVGWACDEFVKNAESVDSGETVEFLSELAQQYNVNILGGSFIEDSGTNLFNTCPVFNRTGELVATYRKSHLFSYYDDCENKYITAGQNPVMVNLDGVKFGLSICYDIRFPEIYRAYRQSEADVLVNMAAWPLSRKIHWDSLTCARAVENQSFMIALTQTGTLPSGAKNLGHSVIYDFSGNVMDEINSKEGCISATFDLNEMYEFRQKCTVLNDILPKYEVIKK